MTPSARLALLGVPVVAVSAAAVFTSAPGGAQAPLHVALFVGAGALWAAALALVGRVPRGRGDVAVLIAVAIAVRLPAWSAPPAHSDDAYRYAWDGRVARAGVNPFLHPPVDPALAHLRDVDPPGAPWTRAAIYPRINHRDLPTIYPPVAQLAFGVAASLPLPPLVALRLVMGLCDLAVLALLVALCRRTGDPRQAMAWGWSPLVAIELGQNLHVDALALVGLVGALHAWRAGRRGAAGLLLGLSTGAKLVAAPLVVAFRSRRAVGAWLAACMLASLPYAAAGTAMAGSTGEFARRWRGNDGAYALLQAATDRLVCRVLDDEYAPGPDGAPCRKPLDLWPHTRLAALISGRSDRAAVYPDEVSGLLARGLSALGVLAVVLAVVVRRADPVRGASWIFGALLLLTPALKPWYVTWLVPLVALDRRPAFVALAVLAPLAYLPAVVDGSGRASDALWTRLVEHGACWLLLASEWLRYRRATYPPRGAAPFLDRAPPGDRMTQSDTHP